MCYLHYFIFGGEKKMFNNIIVYYSLTEFTFLKYTVDTDC